MPLNVAKETVNVFLDRQMKDRHAKMSTKSPEKKREYIILQQFNSVNTFTPILAL